MPITFVVEPVQRTVVATALGIVSAPAIIHHLHAKAQARAADFDELFDARNVTLDLSSADLIAIAKAVRDMLGDAKPGRSAVVTDSPMIYTLAKTFTDLTGKETSDVQVFTSINRAREWLGLREPGAVASFAQ